MHDFALVSPPSLKLMLDGFDCTTIDNISSNSKPYVESKMFKLRKSIQNKSGFSC